MRLRPDLLFASGREVSGHLVSVADGRVREDPARVRILPA
jgi:hypothetical protein